MSAEDNLAGVLGQDLDAPHLGLLDDVPFQPVFIMGDHRSGTSLLYILLEASGCFNVVHAYHVIRYREILANRLTGQEDTGRGAVTEWLRAAGQSNRIIDGVEVSAELPEEYGFLLDNRSRPQVKPATLARFTELCKKVQFLSQPDRPLLLKNPWDYLNFGYIKTIFPSARFIFVHREPTRIIDSQLRAIRSLMEVENPYTSLVASWYRDLHQSPLRLRAVRALYAPGSPLGFRITYRHVRKATGYFLKTVRTLDPTDFVDVRYEDLCANTAATMARILSFLRLQSGPGVDYHSRIQPRTAPLSPEVERHRDRVQASLQPYRQYCNYNLGSDGTS